MRKIKKILMLVLAVAVIAAAVICVRKPEEKMTSGAVYGDVRKTVEVTGKIYGIDEVTYYSDVNAKISSSVPDVGDNVKKGDILVAFDLHDLENELTAAVYNAEYCENGYAAAVSENEKNTNKYNNAVLLDETCKKQYEDAMNRMNELNQSQYDENLGIKKQSDDIRMRVLELNNQIAAKTTELSNIQLKITLATFEGSGWSMKFLENQGEIIQNELLELNTAAIGLEKEIEQLPDAQMNSEEYSLYLELTKLLEDISRDWADAKTDKTTADAGIINENTIKQLENSLQTARLNEDIAEENLNNGRAGVASELNGIISEKYVNEGAYVTKGSPLYTVCNTDELKVTVEISKYDISDINEGQNVLITVGEKEYEGKVSKINRYATVDSSDNSKVRVDIHINNPDDNMIIGLEADVTIYVAEALNVLTIPAEALYTDDGGSYCYVVNAGKIEKQYITAGMSDDNRVEVTDGITEGMHVIVDSITDADIGEKINENFN